MLFPIPLAVHCCSTGWTFPVLSYARQQSPYVPGADAFHSQRHGSQEWTPPGSPSIASLQVSPLSVLTSTRVILPSHDRARPGNV